MFRWENWHGQDEKQFRGHTQEFTENELVELCKDVGFKTEQITGIYPSITFKGNWLWIAYRLFEYLFWWVMKLVRKGTSKNIYLVVKK